MAQPYLDADHLAQMSESLFIDDSEFFTRLHLL